MTQKAGGCLEVYTCGQGECFLAVSSEGTVVLQEFISSRFKETNTLFSADNTVSLIIKGKYE